MLHRKDTEGIVVISQPAHAWVAGQLARAWGGGDFLAVPEEVCLAAEQHDLGFLEWEENPTLNPATSLPYTFLELPRTTHLAIWSAGIRHMLRFGRYPALLVSMHYTGLARRGGREDSPEDKQRLNQFLEQQDVFQTTLKTSLSNDFHYANTNFEDSVQRHQQLVSLWDWMSLLLCHGLTEPKRLEEVPTTHGVVNLDLKPLNGTRSEIQVSPWPFRSKRLELVCEGRRLLGIFKKQPAMRKSLRAAAPVMVLMQLTPG